MEFILVEDYAEFKNLKLFNSDFNICSSSNNGSFEPYFKQIKTQQGANKKDFFIYLIKDGDDVKCTIFTNVYGFISALFIKPESLNVDFVTYFTKELYKVLKERGTDKITIHLRNKGLVIFNKCGYRNMKCICDMEQRTTFAGFSYQLQYSEEI